MIQEFARREVQKPARSTGERKIPSAAARPGPRVMVQDRRRLRRIIGITALLLCLAISAYPLITGRLLLMGISLMALAIVDRTVLPIMKHLFRRQQQAQRGADGESKVAEVLSRDPDNILVLHNVAGRIEGVRTQAQAREWRQRNQGPVRQSAPRGFGLPVRKPAIHEPRVRPTGDPSRLGGAVRALVQSADHEVGVGSQTGSRNISPARSASGWDEWAKVRFQSERNWGTSAGASVGTISASTTSQMWNEPVFRIIFLVPLVRGGYDRETL